MEHKKETCTGKKHHHNPSSLSHISIPESYVGKYPANGVFPSKPFYGMQIFYAISHAAIKKQDDFIGREAERVIIGDIMDPHIELNGHVRVCSEKGCSRVALQISLTDIANPDNTMSSYISLSSSETAEEPFHLSLDLSPAILEAHVTIVIIGEYDSCTKHLKITGKLKADKSSSIPSCNTVFPYEKAESLSSLLSSQTKLGENGTLLWKCASLTDGPDSFPTGSYQISEEGYILLEKTSPSSVFGTYFGIPELYGSGNFSGVIRQDEFTGQIVIDANWHGNPPYYCKETFEPGKLRIAFHEDGNKFHLNFSQCGEPALLSNPPHIGYLVYPGLYPLDGTYWEYKEMPGQQISKEGTLRTVLNPFAPGLLSNSILGFYDHNKGNLNGRIIGNILLSYFLYSLSDERICFGEACFLFDPFSHSFAATWTPAGFL